METILVTLETILVLLMFGVLAAMLWDVRRTQFRGQASLERIEESAERIAQMAAEVLRRTPAPPAQGPGQA